MESSFGRQSSGGLPGSHCGICGGEYSIQGPFWSAPLHDYEYIMALEEELSANYMYLKTNKRISATLEAIKQVYRWINIYIYIYRSKLWSQTY